MPAALDRRARRHVPVAKRTLGRALWWAPPPLWFPFRDEDHGRGDEDDEVWAAVAAQTGWADMVLVPGFPLFHPDHVWLTRTVVVRGLGRARLGFYVEQPYASWRLIGRGRRTWTMPGLTPARGVRNLAEILLLDRYGPTSTAACAVGRGSFSAFRRADLDGKWGSAESLDGQAEGSPGVCVAVARLRAACRLSHGVLRAGMGWRGPRDCRLTQAPDDVGWIAAGPKPRQGLVALRRNPFRPGPCREDRRRCCHVGHSLKCSRNFPRARSRRRSFRRRCRLVRVTRWGSRTRRCSGRGSW